MTISAIMTLAQWLSPAYPLGSFAYSHGLETAIDVGWVHDAATLENWLQDVLGDGSGRADATLLGSAYRAVDHAELMGIDATGRAFASSQERLRESLHQGAAFARTTSEVSDIDVPDVLFPVAFGWAAAWVGVSLPIAAPMYLHAFASNIVMASVRLMPLGQTAAQSIVKNLIPICEETACAANSATLDDLYSNTFLSDIAAMRHEVHIPRLFQS